MSMRSAFLRIKTSWTARASCMTQWVRASPRQPRRQSLVWRRVLVSVLQHVLALGVCIVVLLFRERAKQPEYEVWKKPMAAAVGQEAPVEMVRKCWELSCQGVVAHLCGSLPPLGLVAVTVSVPGCR